MLPRLNHIDRAKIKTLRRRQNYLEGITAGENKYAGRDWDLGEAGALKWIIDLVEKNSEQEKIMQKPDDINLEAEDAKLDHELSGDSYGGMEKHSIAKAGLRDPKCGVWGYPIKPGPQVPCKLMKDHDGDCYFGIPATGGIVSRDSYGSTVEGRDVPAPVAPSVARERGSAARSGSSAGDDTSEGIDGPPEDFHDELPEHIAESMKDAEFAAAVVPPRTQPKQQTLLNRCPRCGSPKPALHPAVQFEGEVQVCKDEWHGC